MLKLIIADDSSFMRKALTTIVEKDPEIKVIATARNGQEAVRLVKELDPDILTLDIEMPLMNGLEALEKIIAEHPMPVIMISSLTKDGANETLKALEIGAVDYISKGINHTNLDILKIENEIIEKIKNIGKRKNLIKSRLIRKNKKAKEPNVEVISKDLENPSSFTSTLNKFKNKRNFKIIAIGASTGGPSALQEVISNLPKDLPCSIVVAQHMPAGFTKTFAERLDSLSKIKVKEAQDKDQLEDSTVYIAPGNYNMYLIRNESKVLIKIDERDFGSLYKPSVDILISSVAEIFGKNAIGIILTGMGCDGLKGLQKLKSKNGFIIAQDETTSIIYGMPKAVIENKIADRICPIDKIANEIISLF